MADPKVKDDVMNYDIVALDKRIKGFQFQLSNCQSSNNDRIINADMDRIDDYIEAIKTYVAFVTKRDPLDLPHLHPTVIELTAKIEETSTATNQNILDIIRSMETIRVEAVCCNSRTLASGLNPADKDRIEAAIEKLEDLMNDYVKPTNGLDTPEDQPSK